MEHCCKQRRDVLGTFEGPVEEHHQESVEQDELMELLEGNKITSKPWEHLYQCKECGQYWLDKTEGGGRSEHTVYQKLTEAEALERFPELRDKS
jgi:hypothetical protein